MRKQATRGFRSSVTLLLLFSFLTWTILPPCTFAEENAPVQSTTEASPKTGVTSDPPATEEAKTKPAETKKTETSQQNEPKTSESTTKKTDKSTQKSTQTPKKTTESTANQWWHEVADVKAKPSFDMDDYQGSEKGWKDSDTPWYKHWGFWTAVGVAAFAGGMIGVYYVQKDPKDSLVVRTVKRN